jgi:hypothetical protein
MSNVVINFLRNFLLFFITSFLFSSSVFAAATIDHDEIRLQSLNKMTAQTSTFALKIGETYKLGPLYIKAQACRTAPATEKPESAAFIQIWAAKEDKIQEKTDKEAEWVFSGWMFASSPGLSSMDHPVYDLWVIDCGEDAAPKPEDIPDTLPAEEEGEASAAPENAAEVIEEEAEEDAPVVIIDGEALTTPETREEDPRFQDYDAEETAPILHLE